MRTKILLSLALLVFALAVRLHALPATRYAPETIRVAKALAAGRGWSDAFAYGSGSSAHTAPLYPLLLSGVYRLCGDYTTPSGRLGQDCFSLAVSLLVLFTYPLLARKLGLPVAAGWIAAFVRACDVHEQEIAGLFENVLATLDLLAVIWCLADLRQRDWKGSGAWIRTGLLLGLTALLSPNLLAVVFLYLVLEWLRSPGRRQDILRGGVVLAMLTLMVATPWLIRCYYVLGGFVPMRSNFGLELAIGNRADANGYTMAPGFRKIHPSANTAERSRLMQMGELAYMKAKQQQALTWIVDHPRQFAWLTWQRARRFFLLRPELGSTLDLGFLRWHLPYLAILPLGAAIELLRLSRRNPATAGLLACAVVGVALPYLMTHVESRYRLPTLGLQVMLCGNLLLARTEWLRGKPATLLVASLQCSASKRVGFLMPLANSMQPKPTTSHPVGPS